MYEASGAKEIMQNKELTREQVERMLDALDSSVLSDGVFVGDLRKHDTALRARLAEVERDLQAIQATVGDTEFALRARVAELEQRNTELEGDFLIASEQRKAERQQLATVTAERDEWKKKAEWKHVHDDSLECELKQQLAAAQARCREMEADRSIKMNESRKFASYVVAHSSKKSARHNAHYAELIGMAERHLERAKDIPSTTPWLLEMMEVARRDKQGLPQLLFQANETIAQLQATLAAREAEVESLKVLAWDKRQEALKERDAAVQEAGRLRERIQELEKGQGDKPPGDR